MEQPVQVADERTRQLVRIVDQMQEFIEKQLSRWDSVVATMNETTEMHSRASRMLKKAEAEKANWDKEHSEQIARLQGESELLEQAWKRVETEERRLAAKEAIASHTHSSVVAFQAAPNGRTTAAPAAQIQVDQDLDATSDRLAAEQEFRKLSAEIANHSKRAR